MKTIYSLIAILSFIGLSVDSSAQAPNSWTQKANFGGAVRMWAVGFSIGTKGYIGTGGVQGGNLYRDFWQYDTTTNTWTQKANFGGVGRYRAVGFSIGSKGYIGTGQSGSASDLNDFWEYDTTSNAWTQKANFGGAPRLDAVGFSIGSKGYIGTGANLSGDFNDFWEYDPSTNIWTQKANVGGIPRNGAVGFSIGNKGYVGIGEDLYSNLYNDFWEYNPTTNAWSQEANFGGTARGWATGFGIGSQGYIGTGWDFYVLHNDFWEYDTSTNTWTQRANFGGTARAGAVGFNLANKGYIGTGLDNANYRNDFWAYTPSCILPVPPTNTTPPANQNICTGHSATLSASGTGTLGWYNAPTGGTWLGGGSTFTTPILTSDTAYYVQDSTCGPSLSRTRIPVTVNPLPVPTITGQTSMCVNSGYYNYTTEAGMTNYVWTVSSGGIINYGSGTNQIEVTWIVAGPQTVSVTYTSAGGCNPVSPTVKNVTVNPLPGPAGMITGTDTLCAGTSGVTYSVAPIPNTIVYIWSIPPHDTIASGAGSNSITVDFGANATNGDINVYGNNICGDGPVSLNFFVTVNPIPPTPVLTMIGPNTLHSSAPVGNQWYLNGNLLPGATGQTFIAVQWGYYWTIVTINGCPSDSSNHVYWFYEGINSHSSPAFEIYPVPNDGMFNISITAGSEESFSIVIYNTLGVKVYEERNVEADGSMDKMIDLRSLASGVYTVIVSSRQGQGVRKFVKD
jgi:hypothetical protein